MGGMGDGMMVMLMVMVMVMVHSKVVMPLCPFSIHSQSNTLLAYHRHIHAYIPRSVLESFTFCRLPPRFKLLHQVVTATLTDLLNNQQHAYTSSPPPPPPPPRHLHPSPRPPFPHIQFPSSEPRRYRTRSGFKVLHIFTQLNGSFLLIVSQKEKTTPPS